jgi:tetratricopeptide (TPR) repeat protein
MNKMAPDEGALFLLRRSKAIANNQFLNAVRENDRAVAQEICRKMDCLPLALDQAGAFIEEAPCTPTEYLALYSSHGEALRARRGKLAGDHPSVSVTFSMAFTRLLDTNTAAAELVRACAFLAPDAIPEEVFTAAGREWGEPLAEIVTKPLGWIETIEEAGRFALIRRDAELKNLQIHRVVREVIKDGMSEQARRSLAERAVHALNRVFPKAEFENWPQCQRLISHSRMAASLIEEFNIYSAGAARLLNDSVFYLVERGEYAEAEPVYRRVIAMRETLLGPEHPDTVQTLNALAVVYHHQGRYSEAEPLYHRVLTTREKVLGPEHPDTAQTLNNLAGLYHQQGLYAEAEPLYYRCLALRERALGSEHPDTAQSAHNLALLRQNQGRHTEAEQLYRRALSIFQGAHGLDHPDVATALNNLGELYRIQGLYNDAELLLHRALAVREKVLGPEHPDTVSSIRNYAELLRKLGKDGEAEKLEARGQQARR